MRQSRLDAHKVVDDRLRRRATADIGDHDSKIARWAREVALARRARDDATIEIPLVTIRQGAGRKQVPILPDGGRCRVGVNRDNDRRRDSGCAARNHGVNGLRSRREYCDRLRRSAIVPNIAGQIV